MVEIQQDEDPGGGGILRGAYLFPRGSFDGIEGGMLEPVTVIEIVNVEQLRKRVDAGLPEALLLHHVGLAMRDQAGGGGGRGSGQVVVGRVVERVPIG